MQVTTQSLGEFTSEAVRFVSQLTPDSRATIVALSGELGAGKTTFVQVVAKELGIEEPVTSPTFVIEKAYQLPAEKSRGFARLIHIDAYRLTGARDLEVLGWKEIAAEPTNLILMEWAENVGELVPLDAQRILLKESGESRTITYGKKD